MPQRKAHSLHPVRSNYSCPQKALAESRQWGKASAAPRCQSLSLRYGKVLLEGRQWQKAQPFTPLSFQMLETFPVGADNLSPLLEPLLVAEKDSSSKSWQSLSPMPPREEGKALVEEKN